MGHRLLYIPKPVSEGVKLGLLYNWWAATDSRGITSSDDWRVPTNTDFSTLSTYLGGNTVAGGKLKETGLTYWNTPNTGADNASQFSARGAGRRDFNLGIFDNIQQMNELWGSTEYAPDNAANRRLNFNDASFILYSGDKRYGFSVRLKYTGAGTPTSYTGNDGKVYPVVQIGTQYWLAVNLAETKYRIGVSIPEVTDNTAWDALTTGALCAYDNDWDNV